MKKVICSILVVVVILALSIIIAYADVHSAQYKSSKVCGMCHKNINKDIVDGYQSSSHFKAMRKANESGAIVADFSGNSAFGKDKVAYVLGSGRTQQAYLDADYKVLPAIWDVKAKSWKATKAVDGSTQCIGCHVTGYDVAQKTYVQQGVGCESCHGPGSDHISSTDRKATIIKPSNLDKAKQSMVCGQCHSVGKQAGGNTAFAVGFRPGDDLPACFVDANPTKPGRNQQYSEFVKSKHKQIGITCTTCHDPHNISKNVAQLKKPINKLCLGCHAAKIKDIASHAPTAPAGATCATCHMPNGQHKFTKTGS